MAIYVRPTKRLCIITVAVIMAALGCTMFIAYTLGQEATSEAVRRHYEHMENSK